MTWEGLIFFSKFKKTNIQSSTYRFFISNWKPISSEIMQHLVIKQFFFHRIVEIDEVVHKQVFFEEEEMMLWFGTLCCARTIYRNIGSRPVLFPFCHDICHFFFSSQATFGITQNFINCISCKKYKK